MLNTYGAFSWRLLLEKLLDSALQLGRHGPTLSGLLQLRLLGERGVQLLLHAGQIGRVLLAERSQGSAVLGADLRDARAVGGGDPLLLGGGGLQIAAETLVLALKLFGLRGDLRHRLGVDGALQEQLHLRQLRPRRLQFRSQTGQQLDGVELDLGGDFRHLDVPSLRQHDLDDDLVAPTGDVHSLGMAVVDQEAEQGHGESLCDLNLTVVERQQKRLDHGQELVAAVTVLARLHELLEDECGGSGDGLSRLRVLVGDGQGADVLVLQVGRQVLAVTSACVRGLSSSSGCGHLSAPFLRRVAGLVGQRFGGGDQVEPVALTLDDDLIRVGHRVESFAEFTDESAAHAHRMQQLNSGISIHRSHNATVALVEHLQYVPGPYGHEGSPSTTCQ